MKIKILTKIKHFKAYAAFSKKINRDVPVFFYDEDVFWFTYKKTRYGLNIPMILKLQKQAIKKLNKK